MILSLVITFQRLYIIIVPGATLIIARSSENYIRVGWSADCTSNCLAAVISQSCESLRTGGLVERKGWCEQLQRHFVCDIEVENIP